MYVNSMHTQTPQGLSVSMLDALTVQVHSCQNSKGTFHFVNIAQGKPSETNV